jgi:hypothetical protein
MVITNTRLGSRQERISNAAGWDTHVNILEDVLNGDTPRGFWTMHAGYEELYADRLS